MSVFAKNVQHVREGFSWGPSEGLKSIGDLALVWGYTLFLVALIAVIADVTIRALL